MAWSEQQSAWEERRGLDAARPVGGEERQAAAARAAAADAHVTDDVSLAPAVNTGPACNPDIFILLLKSCLPRTYPLSVRDHQVKRARPCGLTARQVSVRLCRPLYHSMPRPTSTQFLRASELEAGWGLSGVQGDAAAPLLRTGNGAPIGSGMVLMGTAGDASA